MYQPARFAETDRARLLRVIRENPFATLITPTPEGPFVSHVPLLVSDEGSSLMGHVARANPHWKHFAEGVETLAIFHGPHCYVSPSWYVEREHVPTWNYVVVHASGMARVVDEPARVMAEMEQMVGFFEGPGGWTMDRAGRGFAEGLARGIVCFEIPIARIEGKFKLSQNRSEEDREGVLRALDRATDEASAGVLRWMREIYR